MAAQLVTWLQALRMSGPGQGWQRGVGCPEHPCHSKLRLPRASPVGDQAVARNVVLLLSSWGWNWSLILSWAHPPPHKYLPRDRADGTEAPLSLVPPAIWAPWQQMHFLETRLIHHLIPSSITAPVLARSTLRGSTTV